MDIVAVVIFLVMYYLRPQEWTSLFATIHFVQLVMIMAIVSLFLRERQFRFGDLLKTPHDWAIFAFFFWMVASSEHPFETFKLVYPMPLYYVVIVQTLFTVKRMNTFVGWWTFLIIGVAALAVASEYGFDPRNSYELTHWYMKDRLALNLSIFNNPNALGHSIAPSIAMLYFFCIWKRPVMMRALGFGLLTLPLWCIWLTVSKGAFLSAAVTIVATLTFGRPRTVQIVVIAAAVMMGTAALYKLPRMTELNHAKSDAAIQGRVIAFTHGLKMIQSTKTGIGYGNWMPVFIRSHHFIKAAHSSYVQIGAELGYPGLFLLFAILYCNMRTLVTAQTGDEDEERIRRTLFVLVLSYIVSSWMVDFGYRPTFFMFTAVVAAFHRHLYGLNRETEETPAETSTLPAWAQRILPAFSHPATPVLAYSGAAPAPAAWQLAGSGAAPPAESGEETAPRRFWNRFNVVDLAIVSFVTYGAVRFWAYLITRM